MYKNPIFHFDATTETGIDTIPSDALVYIKDVSGSPKQVLKIDNTGMTSSSTVQDFLDDTNLWKEIPDGPLNAIVSDTSLVTNSSQITNIVQISQSDYDNLGSYDSSTMYVII
jgi:hypothetical protein